jgi:hypothetical protein
LRLLSLFGIVTITDAAIEALFGSDFRLKLETLDINGCREVTRSDEGSLKELFPNVNVFIYHS